MHVLAPVGLKGTAMIGALRSLLGAVVLVISTGAHASSIAYALTVQDIGAPSTFGFLYFTPIAGQSGLSTWSFAGSMTMVDETGDGVSASNSGTIPEFWQLAVLDGSNQFHIVSDAGGAAVLNGAGPHNFAAGGTFDCSTLTGGCLGMSIRFEFTLSGAGDRLSSTGEFDLNPAVIPEPATLVLVGLGLTGLALARRRVAT